MLGIFSGKFDNLTTKIIKQRKDLYKTKKKLNLTLGSLKKVLVEIEDYDAELLQIKKEIEQYTEYAYNLHRFVTQKNIIVQGISPTIDNKKEEFCRILQSCHIQCEEKDIKRITPVMKNNKNSLCVKFLEKRKRNSVLSNRLNLVYSGISIDEDKPEGVDLDRIFMRHAMKGAQDNLELESSDSDTNEASTVFTETVVVH